MCGIWAILGAEYTPGEHEGEFMKIMGRGPDLTVVTKQQQHQQNGKAPSLWFGFHRLAIVQPGNLPCAQPIILNPTSQEESSLSVVCNGEIYNHLHLKADSAAKHPLVSSSMINGSSDCAAIIHAFLLTGGDLRQCCAALDGVFAFAMADSQHLYIGRDPLGVRPLFYGRTPAGGLLLGSEVKCIEKLCTHVEYFPPGCCATIPLNNRSALPRHLDIQQYFYVPSLPIERTITISSAKEALRTLLIGAVEKRLMGNRLFGFMLSGGLDSSLIASIASRFLLSTTSTAAAPIAFSVGFEDSPDLEQAKRVANYLGIPHRILVVTPEECVAAIPQVIYAMETFDPLLVRCGVVHWLLCKHISASSDVKVLLSGEGADELFGSYAYMQLAPTPDHLHEESLRRLKHLHQYDVLRCDRATSCHGLEIRVPFLDKRFVEYSAALPPSYKLAEQWAEKHLLRSAFEGWLPEEVLWRQKEGFAEALGRVDLGEQLMAHAGLLISDELFEGRVGMFPWKTPDTKEEYWYRSLFEGHFDRRKVEGVIHTKVYRTAAWQVAPPPPPPTITIASPPPIEEKENLSPRENPFKQMILDLASSYKASTSGIGENDDLLLTVAEGQRFRRRSTGSAIKLLSSGVA